MDVALEEMSGRRCWAARLGHGTFLTFDFGDRRTVAASHGNREVGDCHLWIYLAKWSLRVGADVFDWSTAEQELERALRRFEGRAVVSIDVDPIVIRFDGPETPEVTVGALEDAEDGDELFLLYLPRHRVLCCRLGGVVSLEDDRTIGLP